jgi:hypothetical protein
VPAGLPASRLRVTLGFAGLLPALLSAVAPALANRKGENLDGALAEVRERRVLALTGRLLSAGAAPAAAREIARSLLVGFDPGSALFSQPVLRGPASALARAAAIVTSSAAGCEVVVDLAGTPDTPYYTAHCFRRRRWRARRGRCRRPIRHAPRALRNAGARSRVLDRRRGSRERP